MNPRFLTSSDFPAKKNNYGKGLCRFCETEVQGRRRTWCSDNCIREYLIRTNHQYARSAVYGRDKGVCPTCSIKTRSWQMDHIIPVCEGGGGCGLDNLRTLCIECHKLVTKELNRKRSNAV